MLGSENPNSDVECDTRCKRTGHQTAVQPIICSCAWIDAKAEPALQAQVEGFQGEKGAEKTC